MSQKPGLAPFQPLKAIIITGRSLYGRSVDIGSHQFILNSHSIGCNNFVPSGLHLPGLSFSRSSKSL